MATKKIMAWSKCQIDIGLTEDGLMAETLTNVGTIKDKSSSLEPSDGDALEAIATGGETVAKEVQEGGFTLTTRIIEPTTDLLTLLGISEDGLSVTTHIVDGDWSVQVTPKNKGAYGLKAPKCSIAYKPGWSEEEGNYADLEIEILKGEADYWYQRFVTESALK